MPEEPEEDEIGLPEEARVRKGYTMSPEALFARRMNAQKSTGPNTPEGKSKSKKNAWKHGKYASSFLMQLVKPCKTTCPDFPCPIVNGGATSPGNACLDKEHFIELCDALEGAMNGNHTPLRDLAIVELASNFQVIRELREAVFRDGAVLKEKKVDKDGKHIGDEYKVHPALLPLPKLMAEFGLTLPQFLMTPQSMAKARADGEQAKGLAAIFGETQKKLKGAEKKK